jgi:hypothetical protein
MDQSSQNQIPPDDTAEIDQTSSTDDEDDSRCDCEFPGYFYSGVPGIVARVENGRLVADATVERCDLCQLYASDEAALARLRELGIA